MTKQGVRVLLAAVAAACVVVSFLEPTFPGEVVYFVVYVPLCVLSWRAALRRPVATRRPWLVVALTSSLMCLGDGFSDASWYSQGRLSDAMSWCANVTYVCAYIALVTAVVTLVRRHTTGSLRPLFLDVATLVTAVTVVAWETLISPRLSADSFQLYDVMGAIYPLFDVTLTACVLLLILAPGVGGPATKALIASTSLVLVYDLASAVLSRWWTDDQLSWLVGPLLFGNALLVFTVLHPDSGRLSGKAGARRSRGLHPARMLLLGAALVAAPLTGFTIARPTTSERIILATATMVGTGFVLARISGAVRDQDRAQRQLAYQAEHDPLTGLLNRRTVHDRLGHLLATGDGSGIALLYIDLDGFKAVNDGAGHEAGDAILVTVARRLTAAVRTTDLVARLGGDEFVVVCADVTPDDGGRRLADRLLHDLSLPVHHGGAEHQIGASIGIAWATAPEAGDAWAQRLMRTADTAMYQAKRLGRGQWIFTEAGAAPANADV